MSPFQHKLNEIAVFFHNKDTHFGFRKLLDAVADTQDMKLYHKAIQLTDKKENSLISEEELITESLQLLTELTNVSVTETSRSVPIITAKNITKSYGLKRFSLGPISLSIQKGEVYGLVGENGNGKTTLLRILASELSYDSGTIRFQFSADTEFDSYDLRTKLVYIPQRTDTWYGSLQDNLKFVLSNYRIPSEEIDSRVLLMIARFGLWNYKHLKWSELSSGYKMRFELARTLLRKPEVLLLDEPLANLDVLAQQLILEDLKSICDSLSNPVALILSSQQLYEVEKISDKVIYLKNGKYTDNSQKNDELFDNQLIVEIDSSDSREAVQKALENLQLEKLVYNGGVYIAYFPSTVSFSQVLKSIGSAQVTTIYIRNISVSTRRFFVS